MNDLLSHGRYFGQDVRRRKILFDADLKGFAQLSVLIIPGIKVWIPKMDDGNATAKQGLVGKGRV